MMSPKTFAAGMLAGGFVCLGVAIYLVSKI